MGRTRTARWLAALFIALLARADELVDRFFDAVQKGDVAAVKTLLAKGLNVNTPLRVGTTALHFAAQKGHAEIVRILLEHGADVNAKDTEAGFTPLLFAAFKGHAAIVQMLLDRGASEADRALMPAVFFGHAETVKALLGAKDLKPEMLSSALAAATQAGRKDMAELLRKAGATPPDPRGGFQADPETLRSYAGTYRTPDGIEFHFEIKGGALSGGNIFDDPAALKAVDRVTFRLPGFEESTIIFNLQGGRVVGFVLKQRAGDTVFRKVEQK